jgi:hypothetical protein
MRPAHILFAGVLSLAVSPAFAQGIIAGGDATPNFVGSTGLLETPSASTVGDKGFSIFTAFTPNYNTYVLLFGPMDRLEVGVSFFDLDGGNDGFAVNAKFTLLKEGDLVPGVAVGVVDVFDEINRGRSWYVVASKDIGKLIPIKPLDLKAHVGYGGGIYDQSPFAALEIGIATPLDSAPGRPSFAFIPEVRNGNVNLGLRGKWRGFGATVALFDFDRVGAMFSYTAGLRL